MTTSAKRFDGETGGERIRRAVEAAAAEPGANVIAVPPDGPDGGDWLLERAIELPSHTTLRLEGATLRLAPGTQDNILRNADYEGGDEDVHVLGTGGARLDGNAARQERVSDGSHRTVGIHLYGVRNATLRGFSIGPTENWAIAPENVVDLRVSDLHFAQGGEKPNQDGLHVTGPAERVTVSGLTGTCGDDAVIARSGPGLYGEGGDLRGMTVTNVSIRNAHSCGVLRTVAQAGSVLDGVYASNLQLLSDEEAGDAALKIGWNGPEDAHREVRPADHRNVVVENVGVNRWDGPFCTIQQPIRGLTLRGVRARHSGPLLWNEENDVVGLTVEDCESTLTGRPPETLLNDFYAELLRGERWVPADQYAADVLAEPPAAVTFDRATLRDVTLRNVRFRSDYEGDGADGHPAALRVAGTARVDGLTVDDCAVEGYATGLRIDEGAEATRVTCRGVRQTDVERPWALGNAPVDGGENDPARS